MDLIVVGKLHKGEPVNPVILSVIDEDLEVFFNLLVNLFGLAVGLQVESHGGILRDVEHSVEFLHEVGYELRSSVRDDNLRHTMSCVYVVMKDSGPSFGREFDVACNRDDGLGESVDNNEEGVMPV